MTVASRPTKDRQVEPVAGERRQAVHKSSEARIFWQRQRVCGVRVVHALDQLTQRAEEVVALLLWAGDFALGLDDPPFVRPARGDVHAPVTAPAHLYIKTAGSQVVTHGRLDAVLADKFGRSAAAARPVVRPAQVRPVSCRPPGSRSCFGSDVPVQPSLGLQAAAHPG